jgi:predicted nucleotidyltransferase
MTRNDVQRILAEHRNELDSLGVKSLELFGSVARDDAKDTSDVDLLVEFDRPIGLFHFFETREFLERILAAAKVDLVLRRAVHPALQDVIFGEAVRVG